MPCSREACAMESQAKDARIGALESMACDLTLRVKKLEAEVATLTQRLPAVPTPGHKQKLALHGPNTSSSSRDRKPVYSQAPAKPANQNILYDAYSTKFMSNDPEPKHISFIQRLHAAGTPKDEIAQRAYAEFPEMSGGRTEAHRKVAVSNAVEMYTSRHAQRYI